MRVLRASALAVHAATSQLLAGDTTPIGCDGCAEWNRSIDPSRIHAGVYYVGTRGSASVLIDTGQGLILRDGALPQSAQRVVADIRELGFEPRDGAMSVATGVAIQPRH